MSMRGPDVDKPLPDIPCRDRPAGPRDRPGSLEFPYYAYRFDGGPWPVRTSVVGKVKAFVRALLLPCLRTKPLLCRLVVMFASFASSSRGVIRSN